MMEWSCFDMVGVRTHRILRTADAIWKQNKTRIFYGYSYTAPTTSIYTIQQLGLGITKGFSILLRNATKISRPHSAQTTSHSDTQLHAETKYLERVERMIERSMCSTGGRSVVVIQCSPSIEESVQSHQWMFVWL